MPRGDRTGPLGQGPMTGRGAGYCAGYEVPGFDNWGGRGFGRGFGRGRGVSGRGMGFGRGWRWRAVASAPYYPPQPYYQAPPISKEEEAAFLKEEMEAMQKEMQEMQARLDQLKKE